MDIIKTLVLIVFSNLATGEYQYARAGPNDRTPLDDYVAREDNTYSYFELVDEKIVGSWSTLHFVNMTSQTWVSEAFTTRSIWWHYLMIVVPEDLRITDTALVFIDGGDNDEYDLPNPDEDSTALAFQQFAEITGSVVVYLTKVPNSPMYFEDDVSNQLRSGDSMIAYTWMRFVDEPEFNTDGIAQMAMTKSRWFYSGKAVIRAMDTGTDFILKEYGHNIEKFVLAGPSKRGWATWTASAVDSRVIAQSPMILTSLDFVPNHHKQYRSLGGWSYALDPYYQENLTAELDNPRTQELMDIIDPYAYMSRYTMPTMVVAATGDQFFLPDDTWYFYDQLPGPKFLRMTPNSDHSLAPRSDAYLNLATFYNGVVTGSRFRGPTWDREFTETGGRIVFRSFVTPHSVVAYVSDTPDPTRRDFRANVGENKEETGVFWEEDAVIDLGDGYYVAEYENPEQGWRAFLIEALFFGPNGEEFVLTSELQIIPDTYPYEDCYGSDCYGTIV